MLARASSKEWEVIPENEGGDGLQKRRRAQPIMELVADTGETTQVPLADFLADPAAYKVGVFAEAPPPVPESVSRLQGILALSRAGLLDNVEALVAQGGVELQLSWANTPDFHRDSALVNTLGAALGLSGDQLDDLFRAADAIRV